MRRPLTSLQLGRDERGFTLIETLVAMFSAVIVVGALYTILDISVQQTAHVTDSVQAAQIGRTSMTKLVDELHSACIAPSFVPVQETSMEKTNNEESKLIFVNAYGSEAELATAYKHEIVWQKSTGLLIDRAYKSTGGTSPEFTWSTTKTETRLGEDIYEGETSGKSIIPIFQYYKYKKESSSLGANQAVSTLELLKLETKGTEYKLGKTGAEEAAAVEISFKQAPADKYIGANHQGENRAIELKNQVTLSFSVPNAETPIEAKPCE
jgi:Prokaryotic N-terminal methylation motif